MEIGQLFPQDEFELRLDRLRPVMEREGPGALISAIWSAPGPQVDGVTLPADTIAKVAPCGARAGSAMDHEEGVVNTDGGARYLTKRASPELPEQGMPA